MMSNDLLWLDTASKLPPYGIPRNGLVSIIDPWRDLYGRNILSAGSENFVGWTAYDSSVITLTQNQTVAEWDTTQATRIQATAGNGTTTLKCLKYAVTASVGSKYYIALRIKNIGTNSVTVTPLFDAALNATVAPAETKDIVLGGSAALALQVQLQLKSDVATNGFDIVVYQPQVNLGQLYPYAPPSGLPQSTLDYSGHGNTFQLGSAAGSDTNDPAWSGNGLTFGGDDYLKSSSPAFDDLQQFTCITVCKANSAGDGGYGRIFEKSNGRRLTFTAKKITFTQGFSISSMATDTKNDVVIFGANQIFGVTYKPQSELTPATLYVNGIKVTTNITSGNGTMTSDASNDLCIGNRSTADRNFDGSLYVQLWYNRILSDAEYMTAYNGLRRLMSARGVVI